MRICIANQLVSVTRVRHAVRDFLVAQKALAPDSLTLGDILLACTEAVSNAIVHGKSQPGTLDATWSVREPGTFEFRLNSSRTEPLTHEDRTNQPDASLAPRGRGLMLIEQLMDTVGYYPSQCDPNIFELVLQKRIDHEATPGGSNVHSF